MKLISIYIQIGRTRDMKKNKLLAALLSLTVVLATLPAATSTAVAEDNSDNIAVQAATGWQPKPTRTVTSSNFPLTINNNEIVQINGPVNYTAATGKSPITVAAGAKAKLIISGNVTLNGAKASGTTGATAAIYVPSNASITIYSAHDETLSTSTAAPQDTLTLKGGNAAAGSNGGNSVRTFLNTPIIKTYEWYTGAGGNGGGGAAAAIGGNGGNGGNGGASYKSPVVASVMPHGKDIKNGDDHSGAAGNNGSAGAQGSLPGKIYISGRLTLNATGGNAAGGGSGGKGTPGYSNTVGKDDMIGGCGGGGGAGGSGGGSGGELSSDHNGNVQGCGGGGGGGGWPNGGGGGGGASECSSTLNGNDNTVLGGDGGAGGAAGGTGKSGSTGGEAGTSGHGLGDAKPGSGGSGGGGVSASAASGGAGGTEKDHKYNAGNGGAGGTYVSVRAWHTSGNLILSTANKLNLSSSLSHKYGDGQGRGTMYAMTPNVVYDLMDCDVTLNSCTYPGADNRATTTIKSINYNNTTDRDGTTITGSNKSFSTSNASISGYVDQKHCGSGKANVVGKYNDSRTTVETNEAVIGNKNNISFTINKATITRLSISKSATPYAIGDDIKLSIGNYNTSSTAGSLSSLCIDSTGTKGEPRIKWTVTSGSGTFSDPSSAKTEFTPTTAGTIEVQVTLSGMNDFNDYSEAISFTVNKSSTYATLSTNNPHPRLPITVTVPDDLKGATFQWYVGGKAVSGATGKTYIVQNSDANKRLYVQITTPASQTDYASIKVYPTNSIQAHNYDKANANGFCSVCGEYQPAKYIPSSEISSEPYYFIMNGGQMFWFAAMVNNDPTHAEFTASDKSVDAMLDCMFHVDLENREWTPIENYSGKISASSPSSMFGYYGKITNMKITGEHLRTGLFANTSNASISGISVEGTISLPAKDYSSSDLNNSVGGIIGKMDGGTLSHVFSKVSISNASGGVYKHVGGVVGEITTTKATVTKALFEGNINIKNSYDCIGGIVGYSNENTAISYCANLGTVTTARSGAYTGGILGYVNNATVTVRNCYNYGSVKNGGGNYSGAIIGRRNTYSSDDSKYTDNYYLNGSASGGYGAGGQLNSASNAPVVKSKAAFTSGEVCYLVNGKTSTDPVWVQNVDNGKTPYDEYPLFHSATVYYRSDGTYSNYAEDVKVNISWGDMSFEYKKGEWDPDTHKYGDAYWSPATDGGNEVTITNNSNVKLNANVTFTPVATFKSSYGLIGTFDNANATLDKAGGTMQSKLTLKTTKTVNTFEEETIGTVKVIITTIY